MNVRPLAAGVLYQALMEHASDAIIMGDVERRAVIDANPRAGELLGRSLEEIIGMPVMDMHPPELRERYDALFDAIVAGEVPSPVELVIRRSDGADIPVAVSVAVVTVEGRRIIQGIFHDISERKKAERQMREETRFRETLIESASEGICLWRRTDAFPYTRFAVWNERMQEITGYSMQEMNQLGWYQTLHKSPEQQAAARQRMEEVAAGGEGVRGLETEVTTKAGKPCSLRISSVPVSMEGDGPWVLAIMEDVTEQRELEANLRQMQKIEALGTLVGGIAHDFNNILTGMLGNIYLAESDAGAQPNLVEKLQVAEALGFRAADLISQLLTFARKGRINMRALDLAAHLRDMFGRGLLSLPENIGFATEFCDEVLPVHGDATQIQQVLMNLLSNARGALRGRRDARVRVRLDRFVPDAHFRHAHGDGTREVYARISVSDNGTGIAPENLERIFEPFFTTKDIGEGTGLGLAMVYSIVQGHGGLVEVESQPGQGTTFRVYLPLTEGEIEQPAEKAGRVPEGEGELILLADDEPDVRQSVAEVISRLGYRVLVAADGEQAWALFRAHHADIALAVLDVVMPGLSGVEVAERMRTLNPDLPVILATGYDAGDELAHAEVSAVLSKPFRVQVLGREIRRCLEGST